MKMSKKNQNTQKQQVTLCDDVISLIIKKEPNMIPSMNLVNKRFHNITKPIIEGIVNKYEYRRGHGKYGYCTTNDNLMFDYVEIEDAGDKGIQDYNITEIKYILSRHCFQSYLLICLCQGKKYPRKKREVIRLFLKRIKHCYCKLNCRIKDMKKCLFLSCYLNDKKMINFFFNKLETKYFSYESDSLIVDHAVTQRERIVDILYVSQCIAFNEKNDELENWIRKRRQEIYDKGVKIYKKHPFKKGLTIDEYLEMH